MQGGVVLFKKLYEGVIAMNLLLLFINGMIFLTCFYGQSQLYPVNWFLVGGMVFSAVVMTLIMREGV